MKKEGYWFAWYPVRLGALGTGRWVWLKTVWRSGAYPYIYQSVEDVERWESKGNGIDLFSKYLSLGLGADRLDIGKIPGMYGGNLELGRYKMAISIHTKDNPPAVFFINDDIVDSINSGKLLNVTLGNFYIAGIPHFFHAKSVEQG